MLLNVKRLYEQEKKKKPGNKTKQPNNLLVNEKHATRINQCRERQSKKPHTSDNCGKILQISSSVRAINDSITSLTSLIIPVKMNQQSATSAQPSVKS